MNARIRLMFLAMKALLGNPWHGVVFSTKGVTLIAAIEIDGYKIFVTHATEGSDNDGACEILDIDYSSKV